MLQAYNKMMIIRRDVVSLSVPVIAEQTFIMLMGVINTIMAGHLGKEAVSAIGMVDSINNIFIAFFSALAVGGTVVVAQYAGRNIYDSANEASRHTIFAGVLLSLAITVVLFLLRHSIIGLLFGSAEQYVIDNSLVYFTITLPTYPLIAVTSIACGVLRGAGDTRTPMKVTIIMNILNIILSYVLIYGLKIGTPHIYIDIPALGVEGAAIGIAIARTAGALLILFALLNGSKLIKLSISKDFRPDFDMLRSIFGVGVPASVESLLFNGGKLITQIFIVGMGTASIAANYIASSVFSLINIPGTALSIAATTLVGQHMGRGEAEEAEDTLLYLTKATSVCLFVLCALVFPFSGLIASVYNGSPDVIEITSLLIKSSVLTMPFFWAVSFLIPAGLKGAGDAKFTMYVAIMSMWVFRITLGYILGIPLKLGVLGVWLGMYIDWVVRGILFVIRLRRGKWKNNVVITCVEEAPCNRLEV